MDSHPLPSIELDIQAKLADKEYRERFFLAEASAEIARQLIVLRKRREYSQKELADRAGTQQPAVSRAERADYHNWSLNTLRQLTSALDGRLTIKIEAWEDVLHEYVESEEPAPGDVKFEDEQASSAPQPPAAKSILDRFRERGAADPSRSDTDEDLQFHGREPKQGVLAELKKKRQKSGTNWY